MKKSHTWITLSFLVFMVCGSLLAADKEPIATLIARIRAVGPQGAGAEQARAALRELAAKGPEILPELLAGMDTPDTVAANWLRTAFEEIVERTLKSDPATIPADPLRRVVLDAQRQGRVRRLALAVLTRLDANAPKALIPPLLDDPEFRYDAVAAALEQGEGAEQSGQKDQAIAAYLSAFENSRHENQIRSAAANLKSLGKDVSIIQQLGYVVDWHVIGPFDGPEFKSFSTTYPPEKELNLQASYPGKSGAVAWKRHRSSDEFGTVNLIDALGAADDAAAYAYAIVESDQPRRVQLRCGADDNLAIWLNGRQVFAKEEWQNGTRFDRFVIPVELRRGKNELLVKVCQGPRYSDPELSNLWSVQLRICDAGGKGVALPVASPDEARE